MFELAIALGEWDVDAIADNMPLHLYYEWRAYNRINPLGQQRHDWNAAMIASVVSNTLIGMFTKSRKRYGISELMFDPERRAPKQTPREIYQAIRRAAIKGMGAKDPKKVEA